MAFLFRWSLDEAVSYTAAELTISHVLSLTPSEVSFAHKVGWCKKSSSDHLSRMLVAGLNNSKPAALRVLYKSLTKMVPGIN